LGPAFAGMAGVKKDPWRILPGVSYY